MTQSTAPEIASRYFDRAGTALGDRIIVKSVFYPNRGWKRHPLLRKRVSITELRRLRGEGITHVQLSCKGREADFSIGELLRQLTSHVGVR
jgi:hypothetical protein